jgi:6-phosphogluconolactonase
MRTDMKASIVLTLFLGSGTLYALPVFIGTNTQGQSQSKGIYRADFDPESGKLSEPLLAAEYLNPGFLALHPEKPILYACGQPKRPFVDDTSGSVAAFEIGSGQELEFLGESSSRGQGPCHIAVDATGKALAVANYGDGTVATIHLDAHGVPGKAATFFMESGKGPHPRQGSTHAHGVYFDGSNRFLFEPDLGRDRVCVFKFDQENATFMPFDDDLHTAPGAGPRHLAFSPDGKHVYVINELDNTILAASYDGQGNFNPIGTVPTLPEGYSGTNTTSEIEVSEDGRFVYGSNRGHDSIVVFLRDGESGALTFVQHAPCGGKVPRHFKIAPGGKWLLCAHQDSSTISVLPRDTETGKLGAPAQTVSSPTPICILFGR